jgi:hypothetical protein
VRRSCADDNFGVYSAIMRKLTLLGFASLLGAGGLAGCGGVDTSGTGGAASSPDITGDILDIYAPSTGQVTRPDIESWTAIAALVEKEGAYTKFPGTIDKDGKLRIPGVPEGPYLLALTSPASTTIPGAAPYTTFFATSARTLDLGTTFSGRADIVSMTQPTFLVLDATLTAPWQAYTEDATGMVTQPLDDNLQFVSRNAAVTGSYIAALSLPEDSPPANGALKLPGWKIDASAAFAYLGNLSLIDSSKGDDVAILHNVQRQVGVADDLDPWKGYVYESTQEVLRPKSLMMTDGGSSVVSGAFEVAKQASFAVDYKGSAFNALVAGLPIDFASVDFSIYMEPGTPHPQIGAFATLLDASTLGLTVYSNPSCGGASCDPAACPSGCDPGKYVIPGDHAHTFSYGNPFDFGQELLNVDVELRANVRTLLPEMTQERLRARFYMQVPTAELNGKPIQPILGFPQAIKVDGKTTPYDQVTTGVGAAPEITWTAPTLGKPTSYRVAVVDLTDVMDKDGNPVLRRTLASFDVTEPRVRLPLGALQTGKFYYLQVSARMQDSDDRAAPYKDYPIHNAYSQMFTGVVTP